MGHTKMEKNLEAIAELSKLNSALEKTIFYSNSESLSREEVGRLYHSCWIESTINHGSCIKAAELYGVWGFRKLYEFKIIDTYRRALEVLRNGTTNEID